MFDPRAYEELGSEFSAQHDYGWEAFGDTAVPPDWGEPELPEIMFRRDRAEGMHGYLLESPDYCEAWNGWHTPGCSNLQVDLDAPPF